MFAIGGDDYVRLLNQTLRENLQKAGFSETFLNEMVAPIMRVNFGQSTDLNAFVGKTLLEEIRVAIAKELIHWGGSSGIRPGMGVLACLVSQALLPTSVFLPVSFQGPVLLLAPVALTWRDLCPESYMAVSGGIWGRTSKWT